MDRRHSPGFAGIAIALLSAAARGQAVHVVANAPGPGVEFTSVQAAIDAATDGDIVLLRPGTYGDANLGAKSLALAGDVGGVEAVGRITSAGASGRVLLKSLKAGGTGNAVSVNSPSCGVSIEDCDFTAISGSSIGQTRLLVTSSAFVTATRTLVEGSALGGRALFVQSTPIATLYGGSFTGAHGLDTVGTPAGPGGAALRVEGGFAFVSAATCQGGSGGSAPLGPAKAGDGGNGAELVAVAMRSLGSTFAGGAPGVAGSPPGDFGVPVALFSGSTWTTLPQTARTFSASTVVREGQTATLTFGGAPGEFAGLVYALGAGPPLHLPEWNGMLIPELATADALLLATLDTNGAASFSFVAPQLPAGVEGVRLVVQPLYFDAAATNVVLGPPATILIVDDTI